MELWTCSQVKGCWSDRNFPVRTRTTRESCGTIVQSTNGTTVYLRWSLFSAAPNTGTTDIDTPWLFNMWKTLKCLGFSLRSWQRGEWRRKRCLSFCDRAAKWEHSCREERQLCCEVFASWCIRVWHPADLQVRHAEKPLIASKCQTFFPSNDVTLLQSLRIWLSSYTFTPKNDQSQS